MSLKKQTLNAFKWNFAGTLITKGGGFVISIILARLLSPKEFGIMGMVMVFIGVSQALIDVGFSSAIIQKKEVSQLELSTVFYINLGLSGFLTLVFFIASGQIALFYEEPEVKMVAQAISLLFVIGGISQVQRSLFSKALNYAILTRIEVIALIVSGVLAISASLSGWGIWALVIQQLSLVSTGAILLWGFSKWRPSVAFSLSSVKELFDYGSKLFISSIIGGVFQRIDTVLIGKIFDSTTLGFYTRAVSFQKIITIISTNGLKVLFPAFSKIKDNTPLLRNVLIKIFKIVSLVSLFISGIFWLIADDLFFIVLGKKWLSAVPYFKILVLMGYVYPVNMILLAILKAIGESGLFLKITTMNKVLMIPTFLILAYFGIEYFLWIRVLLGIIIVIYTLYFTLGKIEESPIKYCKVIMIHLLTISLILAMVLALDIQFADRFLNLGLNALLFVVFFIILVYLTQKKIISDIKILLKKEIN